MDEQMQDVYNEWLIKYGCRPVSFIEVYCDGLIKSVNRLKIQNALTEVFNKEQGTHNYTLQKLTKE